MPEDKKTKSTPIVKIVETAPLIPANEFVPNEGELHIVALDESGNEIAGSDFSISQKQYDKSYAGNNKFSIKKNLQR